MLRPFPLFLGPPFYLTVGYMRREKTEENKTKRLYLCYWGKCSVSDGSVSSAKSDEICSCQRIKPQWAGIPPEWIGQAQRDSPVFTEHLHIISFIPVSANGQVK